MFCSEDDSIVGARAFRIGTLVNIVLKDSPLLEDQSVTERTRVHFCSF